MGSYDGGIDGEEEALGLNEEGAVRMVEGGGMEELAALAADVVAGEGEGDVQGTGAEVVNLQVSGHGQDVQGAVELGHGLIHQGGDDAAVDVAGRAFVQAGEIDCGRHGDVRGIFGVEGEVQMKALRVVGAAAEAVIGLFVEGFVGRVGFRAHELRITRG